jgi:DNA-binding transcriptional ArsR family regulator
LTPEEASPLLKAVVEEYQSDGGLVGEDRNIASLFLVLISKYLPRSYRNHAIIVSSSSAGKSHLANTLTTPFGHSVMNYTRVTGAALDRLEKNLDGRIFLYQQAVGNEPYQFRPIMSEGRLSILVTESEGTNRFASTEHVVEGIPVFIATTTDPNLDPELQNRALILTMDESAQQTRRIIDIRAREAASIQKGSGSSWRIISQVTYKLDLFSNKEIESVVVPFADKIATSLPDEPLELRRDFTKLLNLVRAVAYLKSVCYRGCYELPERQGVRKKLILAEVEDLHDALWCMGDNWLLRLPAKAKRILDFLKTCIKIETGREVFEKVTYQKIFLATGIPRQTSSQYLRLLESKGLIISSKAEAGNVRLFEYHTNEKDLADPDLSGYDSSMWVADNLRDASFKRIDLPVYPGDIVSIGDENVVSTSDELVVSGDGELVTGTRPSTPSVVSKAAQDTPNDKLEKIISRHCPIPDCEYKGVFLYAKLLDQHVTEHHLQVKGRGISDSKLALSEESEKLRVV